MESITYVVSSRGDVPSPFVPAILFNLLDRIAKQKGTTPAQIALAWLLAQKPWIVPIPGTTKLSRLDENIGSLAINLTFDDLREIDSAASKITVKGDRYPEHLLRMSGSEICQSVMTTPSVLTWGITATLIEIAAFGISI